jgi:hypothetical protein
MWIRQSTPLRRAEDHSEAARWLREQVQILAVPRHAIAEAASNRRVADTLALALEGFGYRVLHQGPHRNVVALPTAPAGGPLTLVCAHYDSVPGTPGADDNASALAVLLGAARTCPPGVAFVAFNREEDDLLGSVDFVQWLASGDPAAPAVDAVHVLEMVGYTDMRPGSQRLPPSIPRALLPRDQGDFLAVVGLGKGMGLAGQVAGLADGMAGVPPVVSLQAPRLALSLAPDLERSDHRPFVVAGRPAVMWTDTADLRSPHYHRRSDVPDTLDTAFMAGVLRLLCAVLAR